MFADELAMLTRQFEGRLEIVHYHSRGEAGAGATHPPSTRRSSRPASTPSGSA